MHHACVEPTSLFFTMLRLGTSMFAAAHPMVCLARAATAIGLSTANTLHARRGETATFIAAAIVVILPNWAILAVFVQCSSTNRGPRISPR